MDRNNVIDISELRNVFTHLKNFGEAIEEAEIEELLADADVNHDGQISYDEFLRMFSMKRT